MQLRSGATTGGTVPRTPPRSPASGAAGEIPDQIEITTPQGDQDAAVPRTPVQTPQVYTAGTYVADFGRSPSVPANFRPAQFSFLPQPDYRTAREPSDPGDPDSNGGQPDGSHPTPNQPVISSPQNQMKS